MTTLRLGAWDHDAFHVLSHHLARIKQSPDSAAAVKAFEPKFQGARAWLVGLSNVPGPSDAAKQHVEKNPTSTPSGRETTITGDGLKQVNAIAQLLGISQQIAATLLLQSYELEHRYPGRTILDVAVYVYLQWINEMLDFLDDLLSCTITGAREDLEPTGQVFDLADGLIQTPLDQRKIGEQLLGEIDGMDARITQLRTGAAQGQTGHDLLEYIVGTYKAQQEKMAGIVGLLAANGYLHKGQLLKLLRWLPKQTSMGGLGNMLATAFFAAFRPVDTLGEGDPRIEQSDSWVQDVKYMKLVISVILGDWASKELRAAVKLVFFVFFQHYSHEVAATGLEMPQIDQYINDAVFENAFGYLVHVIHTIRIDRGDELDPRGLSRLELLLTRSNGSNDEYMLARVHEIVDFLAGRKAFVKMLRNKEEDAARRGGVGRYQQFMQLIAATYREAPEDSGAALWEHATFITVVTDIRTTYISPAACEMFAALSRGPTCAARCFEKFRTQKHGWDALIKKMAEQVKELTPIYDEKQAVRQEIKVDGMAPEVYQALVGWLKILKEVTRYSPEARAALAQSKPPFVTLLFDLLNRIVQHPLQDELALQVDILEILTAYAGDEEQQSRILENYARVTPTEQPGPNGTLEQPFTWYGFVNQRQPAMRRWVVAAAHYHFLTAVLAIENNDKARKLQDWAVEQALKDAHIDALGKLPYASQIEHEALLAAVFGFFEAALQQIDVNSLEHSPIALKLIQALPSTPGFKVLAGLLNPRNKVMDLLAQVLLHMPHKSDITLCILRIFCRVLDQQAVFFDVVLPYLDQNQSSGGQRPPSNLQRFDEFLILHPPVVLHIALLVDCSDEAVGLVAVKFIQQLSVTPMFGAGDRFGNEYHFRVNRLAGLLESSDESIRIAQAFERRMEAEGVAMTEKAMELRVADVLKGAKADNVGILIRSTILDMLVAGTRDIGEPNIAHFLLGFDFKAQHFGLHGHGARTSCLDHVFDQLRVDVKLVHPILAAKNARLVQQLFADPRYGTAVMDYATAMDVEEQFSLHHLRRLADDPPPSEAGNCGAIRLGKYMIETTAQSYHAFIDYNEAMLSSIALDIFASKGQSSNAERVAGLMFDHDAGAPLLLHMLNTYDLEFKEEEIPDQPLPMLGNFAFDQYKTDTDYWLLGRMEVAMRHAIPNQARQAGEVEIAYVLNKLGQKNRETEIILAKGAFLTRWAETLKVALSMLSGYIDEERLVQALFDLLHAIAIRLEGDVTPGVIEVLSESTLVLVKRLVDILSTYDGINLPIDRLVDVLTDVLDAVVRAGTSESARGNLYAAVNLYLSLLATDSTDVDDGASMMSTQTAKPIAVPSLHRDALAVVDRVKDRFFAVLCRDAMEVRDVWKTECYSLLGALVSICRTERDRAVLAPLVKAGYLTVIVRSLKDQEMPLSECLSPNPPGLHAFWVFEQKIAFLLATAATRKGAEQLVNAGIFETLSTCSFVHASIITHEVLANHDHREVVMRQHEVLISILQLLVRVLSSAQGSARSAADQALSLLAAHREGLLLLLRENKNAITIVGLEETRLIVAILGMAVQNIPSDEMASPSGMGGFHLAILATGATFFSDTEWQRSMLNNDPKEVEEAAPEVLLLNHAILVYLCATTSGLKSGGQARPVLVTGAQRSAAGSNRYISSAPSLQDTVDLVHAYGEQAANVAKDFEFIRERHEAGMAMISENEVNGMASAVLSEGEYAVEEAAAALLQSSHMLYNMIESLLLLLWRHLLFYANEAGEGAVQPRNLSSSLAYSTQGLASTRGASRQTMSSVAASLGGTLEAIEREVPDELRPGGQGQYHRILVRRLRELIAGLTQV